MHSLLGVMEPRRRSVGALGIVCALAIFGGCGPSEPSIPPGSGAPDATRDASSEPPQVHPDASISDRAPHDDGPTQGDASVDMANADAASDAEKDRPDADGATNACAPSQARCIDTT